MSETALIQVVEGHLIQGNEFKLALDTLSERCKAITHVDKSNVHECAALVKTGEAHIKSIEALAEPERIKRRSAYKDFLADRDSVTAEFEKVIAPVRTMCEAQNAAERAAAKAEEQTLNSRRNGQSVIVKPDLTPRAHVNYSATMADEDRLLESYAKARNNRQFKRAAYLRQFICANLQAINAEARKIKNAARLEAMIPGVLGKETDRI